jgi:pyruvoyl-dependent arginine decarboxylase (PvlArgDC)
MNLVYGDIQITEEHAEELAREHDKLWLSAHIEGFDNALASAKLRGFNECLALTGVMPAVKRAKERLQRQRAE